MKPAILLIEDNPQNRYLLTYLLERSGFSVTSASDGKLGVELAAAQRFDLILLDIQLPARDGYSVATDLRAIPTLVATPIIAVTSFAMAGDRERAMASGFTGYLEKPIDPDTFVQNIQEFLSSADSGKETP